MQVLRPRERFVPKFLEAACYSGKWECLAALFSRLLNIDPTVNVKESDSLMYRCASSGCCKKRPWRSLKVLGRFHPVQFGVK